MRRDEVDALSFRDAKEDDCITPCIYCGMPADSIDHIPPRHMRDQLFGVGLVAMHEREVASCRECNSGLGARPLITIGERRAYIKEYLRRRYAEYLRIPTWSDDELKSFGEGLQKMIERNMLIRDEVRQRLAWKGYRYESQRNAVRTLPRNIHPQPAHMATVLFAKVSLGTMGKGKSTSKARVSCENCRCRFKPSVRKDNTFCSQWCVREYYKTNRWVDSFEQILKRGNEIAHR